MSDSNNTFHHLESIIKVEPEEFQEISENQETRQKLDDILRAKLGIFSEPLVSLDRISVKEPCSLLHLNQFQENSVQNETIETLVRKGNEGVLFKKPHTCCFCQKVFSNRSHLKDHIEALHRKSTKMFCDLCPKHFFNKAYLSQHMRCVHGSKRFFCNVCDYKTTVKNSFQRHQKIHAPKVQKCQVCVEAFGNREDLRRHNAKIHQKIHYGMKRMTCEVCQRQFSRWDHFRRHWKKMHEQTHGTLNKIRVLSREGPFICDKCGVKHHNRNAFIMHNYRNHRSRVIMFCDLCPKSCHFKPHLREHIERIHLKCRQFECKICVHKVFSDRELKVHMLQHAPKTKCKICKKPVANMYNHLYNHVKEKCLICGKIYSKNSIYKHIKTHKGPLVKK